MKRFSFLTLNIRITFNYLQLGFIKVLIFKYLNLECYILIKFDLSNYTINNILNQFYIEIYFDKIITKLI